MENLNYSGVGTFSNLNSTNLDSTNINSSGISTIAILESNQITNSQNILTNSIYSNSGVVTTLSGNELTYNASQLNQISGTNLNYSGVGTIATIDSNQATVVDLEVTNLEADNINSTGISTLNNVEVTDLITGTITGTSGIITSLSGESLEFSNANIGNVKIGIGYTDLHVDGNAQVTGILTVGTGSVTIDGINNQVVGVETFNSNTGIITTLSGTDLTYANTTLDALNFTGINTSTSIENLVNIQASNSAFSTLIQSNFTSISRNSWSGITTTRRWTVRFQYCWFI